MRHFYYFIVGCADVFCQLLDKWSILYTAYQILKRMKGVSLITFSLLVEYAQPNSGQCEDIGDGRAISVPEDYLSKLCKPDDFVKVKCAIKLLGFSSF